MSRLTEKKVFTAAEVANYVVCPQAWSLKRTEKTRANFSETQGEVQRLRGEWLADQDLSARLRRYAKVAYSLLVLLVIMIFLLDNVREAKKRQVERLNHRSGAQK